MPSLRYAAGLRALAAAAALWLLAALPAAAQIGLLWDTVVPNPSGAARASPP